MKGFVFAAVVATQAICAPSDITQPEAAHLAGLAADFRANSLPNFIVLVLIGATDLLHSLLTPPCRQLLRDLKGLRRADE